MRHKKEILQSRFWKFWDNILEKLRSENGCIVVEGIHDAKILTNLGTPLEQIVIIGGYSIEKVANIIHDRYSSAYIFTDFDRRGNQKAQKLLSMLTSRGVKTIDLRKFFLEHFSSLGFKSVGKIEELKTFSEVIPRPNTAIIKYLRKIMSTSSP
ncbi:MAG: toprim domain-containing protein [Candidatus Njordarchaeota archaeon]